MTPMPDPFPDGIDPVIPVRASWLTWIAGAALTVALGAIVVASAVAGVKMVEGKRGRPFDDLLK